MITLATAIIPKVSHDSSALISFLIESWVEKSFLAWGKLATCSETSGLVNSSKSNVGFCYSTFCLYHEFFEVARNTRCIFWKSRIGSSKLLNAIQKYPKFLYFWIFLLRQKARIHIFTSSELTTNPHRIWIGYVYQTCITAFAFGVSGRK